MTGYWAIVSARFRTLLQYRAAAVAGLGTQLFWGLIRVMVFTAFYRSTTAAQPIALEDVVTYVWLGQAFFLGLLPWNVDRDIAALIRSGGVGYELLRPWDLYNAWYSRSLAWRTAPTLLRAVPMLIIAGLFLSMELPASPASAAAFAMAMVGAILLSSAITTLLTITLTWTISGEGATHLAAGIITIFSGMIVPLPLYPDWAQTALNVLPFRGLLDTPIRLYLGHIPASDVLLHLAHQAAWTAVIVLLGRWALSHGLRRLVVQGG